MTTTYKLIRNICVFFVGGFTLAVLGAGMQAQKADGVLALIIFLSLLGLWPSKIAKRKNLGLTGWKLWAYVTFVPVVSWIDIALRPADNAATKITEENAIEIPQPEIMSAPVVQAPKPPVKQYSEYVKTYNEKWEMWEMEHDKPEQRKRRLRSAIDCSVVKVLDKNNGVAIVKGSKGGEYVTSLTMCNCTDFTRRHKPCKHMYCLAAYLRLFDPLSTL